MHGGKKGRSTRRWGVSGFGGLKMAASNLHGCAVCVGNALVLRWNKTKRPSSDGVGFVDSKTKETMYMGGRSGSEKLSSTAPKCCLKRARRLRHVVRVVDSKPLTEWSMDGFLRLER